MLQSASIQNKDIHDDILIAHGILSMFNKNQRSKGYMVIKLDMEKAYHRLIKTLLGNVLLIQASLVHGLIG